jgi:SNF2 family DNA or RNA helicase
MGLGKTLQMISLILKHKELEAEREKNKTDEVPVIVYRDGPDIRPDG